MFYNAIGRFTLDNEGENSEQFAAVPYREGIDFHSFHDQHTSGFSLTRDGQACIYKAIQTVDANSSEDLNGVNSGSDVLLPGCLSGERVYMCTYV